MLWQRTGFGHLLRGLGFTVDNARGRWHGANGIPLLRFS